jgi:hypothetical protein
VLFLAPPDDDAEPHCPNGNQEEEWRFNEDERFEAEGLLEPDA